VTEGSYDDYHVVGVFSTKEKAESFLNENARQGLLAQHPEIKHKHLWGEQGGIEEYEMDSRPPQEWYARKVIVYSDDREYVLGYQIDKTDANGGKRPDVTEVELEDYRRRVAEVSR